MFAGLLARIGQPVQAFLNAPGQAFYWAYLASAVLAALAICLIRSRAPSRLAASLREVFDPKILFHRSAMADYQYVFLNHLLSLLAFGTGVASVQVMASGGAMMLAQAFGPSPDLAPTLLASAIFTMAVFVAGDFGNFYFHWLQHRLPVLWELHKVHHSAEVLTPITALRVHPIAAILGAQFIALCMAVPTAVFLYLSAGHVAEVTVLGINALAFAWYTVLGKHLAHTHVWVMLPKPLRGLFYSPALHLIHHSADPRHFGKNLGFCFSFWDRWAGTLYEPGEADRANLALGIDADEMADFRTIWQLYWTPLRNIAAMASQNPLIARKVEIQIHPK